MLLAAIMTGPGAWAQGGVPGGIQGGAQGGIQGGTQGGTPGGIQAGTPAGNPGEDRLAAMRARGELRVCAWPEYHGISWRNPRNGELEGLDIDMARAFAARLRLRLAIVETELAAIPDAVEAGQCDIGMGGVTVTGERASRVAFTKPYLSAPLVGVANRASARVRDWAAIDRPGVVVAVSDGAPAEAAMRAALRRAELSVLRPPRLREAEVRTGRADVLITDLPYARGLAQRQEWVRLIEAPARFGETLMAYAVARGDGAWLAEANNFLASVKADGSLARSAERFGAASLVVY